MTEDFTTWMPLLVSAGVFLLLVMLASGIVAFAPKSVLEPFRRLADFAARRPLASAIAAADTRPSFIWNVDSLDWKFQSASSIYNRVIGGVKNMDIVLMHQTLPCTAEALERILPKLIEEGYDFVTCTELYNMVGGKTAVPSSHFFLAVR